MSLVVDLPLAGIDTSPGIEVNGRVTMERMKGKTGLVIGAGTVGGGWGNGKACAAQFAREGARVVCFDLDAALAEETAAIIRDEGGEAIGFAGNAANAKDVKAAVDLAVSDSAG